MATLSPEAKKRAKIRQRSLAAFACVGALCGGCCAGWTSPSLSRASIFVEERHAGAWPRAAAAAAHWWGAAAAAPLLAAVACGGLRRWWSPRAGLLAASVACMLGWTLTLWGRPSPATLVGARLVAGAGAAAALVHARAYIAGVLDCAAPASHAPLKLALLAHNSGVLIAHATGEALPGVTFLWAMLGAPVAFFVAFIWAPETPASLVAAGGREAEAVYNLHWLKSIPIIESEKIVMEMKQDSLQAKPSVARLNYTSGLVCLFLYAIQSVGYTILTYSSEIVATITENTNNGPSPGLSSVILTTFFVLGSCASLIVDYKTRYKMIFLSSLAFLALGTLLLNVYIFLKANNYNLSPYGFVPIIILAPIMFAFSLGVNLAPYMISTEFYSIEMDDFKHNALLLWMWLTTAMLNQLYRKTQIQELFLAFFALAVCALISVLFAKEAKSKRLRVSQDNNEARTREQDEVIDTLL